MLPIYTTYDQQALDREYSPSSRIKDINVYLDAYARYSQQAKDNAIKQGSCVTNLEYGPSSDERLDLFLPFSSDQAPIQVYIHGGYWQALTKEDSLFAAPMFQQHGSFFAAINYSLAPSVTLTQIVMQNRRAIAWLFNNSDQWGFDPNRIYLSGSSAGAHLVAMLLLTDWTQYGLPKGVVKGVCAVSGIYDLEPIRLSYVNEPLQMSRKEAVDNSPMGVPVPAPCPIILAYGDNETDEFKRQTDDYRSFLTNSGQSVKFMEINNRNHFNVILDLMDPDSWLSRNILCQMNLIGK